MQRRELLKMIAILTGGAVIGSEMFLSGCTNGTTSASFTDGNIALLDEVGETIIPATDSPGAKATQIGQFMKTIVNDCYDESSQKAFLDGVGGLDSACKKAQGKSFMDCTPQQRHDFLVNLEKEAKAFNDQNREKDKAAREQATKDNKPFTPTPAHYYTMVKQLTLWGYFSSEIGSTKALRHIEIPGHYDGALPYKKGDKAWSI